MILSILVLLGCFGFTGCPDDFGILTFNKYWYIYVPSEEIKIYVPYDGGEHELKSEKTKDNKLFYYYDSSQEIKTKKNNTVKINLIIEYDSKREEIKAEFFIPYLDSREEIQKKKNIM